MISMCKNIGVVLSALSIIAGVASADTVYAAPSASSCSVTPNPTYANLQTVLIAVNLPTDVPVVLYEAETYDGKTYLITEQDVAALPNGS